VSPAADDGQGPAAASLPGLLLAARVAAPLRELSGAAGSDNFRHRL